MITEQYKDKVYFSKWFKSDYPDIYHNVCNILDENNVAHDTLSLTKDYWCRDYMPVQFACGCFAQFKYKPDYLEGKEKYMTNADRVISSLKDTNIHVYHSSLVVDGGNIVVCEADIPNTYTKKSFIVMTDKVLMENPFLSKEEIERRIKRAFAVDECPNMNDGMCIVWLPWDEKDKCGHTDGILKFVGTNENDRPVILANLSVYEENIASKMPKILQEYFEVEELKLSKFDELSWAYINALQTRDVIVVPGIGNEKLDKEAMKQMESLYPEYKGRIYQVQMKSFIKRWGGALNCCTWTVSNDMSKLPHNKGNNERYNSLVNMYRNNHNSLTIEDIKFLGGYYPKALCSISSMLDKLYFGF